MSNGTWRLSQSNYFDKGGKSLAILKLTLVRMNLEAAQCKYFDTGGQFLTILRLNFLILNLEAVSIQILVF